MRVLLSAMLLVQVVAAAPAFAYSSAHLGALANRQLIKSVAATQVSDVPVPSEKQIADVKIADLENAFWLCDYAQTKGMIGMNEETICSAVTDELRRVKFGGEFEKLLAWWQLNKIAQHQELERATAAAIEIKRLASGAI